MIPKFDNENTSRFGLMKMRMRNIFTTLGFYAKGARLNPLETSEIALEGDKDFCCVIFDEFTRNPDKQFQIREKQHSLLLVIEVFRKEMEYAMKHGSKDVLQKLKQKGYYPYSDLDRDPVV